MFWEDASANPIALPFVDDQSPEAMRAYAIADPFANDTIQVVGQAVQTNIGVVWVRTETTWEAIDLNTLSPCNVDGVVWANLSAAYDINACGWIAGTGILDDDSPRAFVLIPMDMCPGDLVSGSGPYPDGVVNVSDMLYVINKWSTSDCVADITEDNTVSTPDLLAVINNWGACPCFPSQVSSMSAPESSSSEFSQMLNAANLSENQWNDFLETMATGTESERENYLCWMQRYLSGCSQCPSCPGSNPFQH